MKIAYFVIFVLQAALFNLCNAAGDDDEFVLIEADQGVGEFSVNPASPDWASLLFWISNGISTFGIKCRRFSKYYCLDAYHTQDSRTVDDPGDTSVERVTAQTLNEEACEAWFRILIESKWSQINMVDFYFKNAPCCTMQVNKYMFHGWQNQNMNPDDYMAKLIDYENEDKPLNFIAAHFLDEFCLNMILDVGFGPGNLRRDHTVSVKEGYPYVLAGPDFGDIGSSEINSKTFDYENIREELTFHWFKHNIMCLDNPWICEDPKNQKKSKQGKKEPKKDKSGKGGNKKKNRRRNKDEASTSKKTEFRRRHLREFRSRKRHLKYSHLNHCPRFY